MDIHIHSDKNSVAHIMAVAEWLNKSAAFLPFTTKCMYDIEIGKEIITVSVNNVSEGGPQKKL